MRYKWLNKKNNESIIIFFNGWGMDESVVKHLDTTNFDVIMFYDYNNLETDFDFEICKKYKNRNTIAWSMGVMIATLFDTNSSNNIAINGTLYPINDNYGIPNRIYDLTIRGFNEKGAKKFFINMFNEKFDPPSCKRSIENQKSELSALKEYKANDNFQYNKILISKEDKIIPTKNQCNFWHKEANIETGHCPFFKYTKWEDLL